MRIIHSVPFAIFFIIGAIVLLLSIGFEEAHLWRAPTFLLLFALSGYVAGGYRGDLGAAWESTHIKANLIVGNDARPKEENFIAASMLFVVLYIGLYAYAISKSMGNFDTKPAMIGGLFSDNFNLFACPFSEFVVILAAISLGTMTYYAARYAIYSRSLFILQQVLAQQAHHLGKQEEAQGRINDATSEAARAKAVEDQARETSFVSIENGKIDSARKVAVKGENLYEPPGNIFVIVGITATFLGLAVALITLDLPSLFTASADNSSEIADAIYNQMPPAADGQDRVADGKALLAINTFIACMGLSLGMSMLGVLHTVAAQWLRGHGPNETTDALLARAALARRGAPLPADINDSLKEVAVKLNDLLSQLRITTVPPPAETPDEAPPPKPQPQAAKEAVRGRGPKPPAQD